MTRPISLEYNGEVAVIQSDNPPVNALSHAVRSGLQDAFLQVISEGKARAIVLICEGRSFFAGADIREFGGPMLEPVLPDLINQIESCPIPVVSAIHGTALGGGLEVAMGTHYRVTADSGQLGLPEVNLGLLPGAGGTQRLPRLVPMDEAAGMITGGRPIRAQKAIEIGLVDKVVPLADLRAEALAFAQALIRDGKSPRPTSANDCDQMNANRFAVLSDKVRKSARGSVAPLKCLEALEAAMLLPFDEGLAKERALFLDLVQSDQRAALTHAFFAERQVGKLPEIKGVSPRDIATVGVVGGGTMGAGITVCSLLSGLDVTLIERDAESVDRATSTVSKLLMGAVKRGKLSQQACDAILSGSFRASTDYTDLAQADLVIEAVFESMEVKKEIFGTLDQVCRQGAILASNTSYLDLNAIAQMTGRPANVIGLHFFSPAHVMRLLEVVVGNATAPDVTATGFALAKRLGKIAVRAGVCDGFIGNRILSQYQKANNATVLAGASPFDVDAALTGFGLAMGPFAVGDLAGLDIGWANRKRPAPTRDPGEVYPEFADRLCEMGRFGRKTGRGFYIYDDAAPNGRPDPEVEEIIAEERAEKGIAPRAIDASEIVERYMAAMVNEAARIVEEGIALRPLDVDVTLLNGYGFPRWRGGPMQYADTVGISKILSDINRFTEDDPRFWQAAPLLERLAQEDRSFASLNTQGE
ncbi:3-hydroxyacyl-CoA dehydrogenase NAD-binding domain-containing protein [Ruegeria lacuscaerulensis]|uniref:3-hydroxyacyl-CoA dehydrogenase NAD-binding domain-containing protein n=1 Tax=Ruegeria lacuscaerulensis TaxID=55218 RepID=UPI00147E5955|nr:3-hydroxyacyl-CoA dehydrogenase NAD-binding domain-containing protein [Ruegeria lacuscaerulensis]